MMTDESLSGLVVRYDRYMGLLLLLCTLGLGIGNLSQTYDTILLDKGRCGQHGGLGDYLPTYGRGDSE